MIKCYKKCFENIKIRLKSTQPGKFDFVHFERKNPQKTTEKEKNHVKKRVFNEKITKIKENFVNLHKKTFNF